MATAPIPIRSQGGIQRDGTKLEGNYYTDGQWCRFQRGRPRKIGGYQAITDTVPEIVRGMTSFSADGVNFLHLGAASTLGQYQVNDTGSFIAFNDRTPAALAISSNNVWQFDHFFDSVGVVTRLIAHAPPNLDIASTANEEIFFGDATAAAILTDTTLPAVSGGIVSLGPYLFSFGNDGRIGWSVVNDPTTLDSEAFITQQKIVKGVPLRGTGGGPAGLFWSLDSLIRATFVGGATVWNFDTLASDVSILSSQGVIEYDGIFFWAGVDRFLMFNGVIREIPNNMNLNWFYDNLNFNQRQKVFAIKVPRFGEIWWCYPRGGATECTDAVIFNVREGTWYDTQLPDSGRSAGLYAKVYNKPFMVDFDDAGAGTFSLWQHETTRDRVTGTMVDAIPSHFETAEIGMSIDAQQPSSKAFRVARSEPDFVQCGDMTVSVRGRINAKAPVIAQTPQTFVASPSAGTDETIKVKEVRRLMSFKFESNVQGGDYEAGDTLAHIEPADERLET